jgi:hypothetical protein
LTRFRRAWSADQLLFRESSSDLQVEEGPGLLTHLLPLPVPRTKGDFEWFEDVVIEAYEYILRKSMSWKYLKTLGYIA